MVGRELDGDPAAKRYEHSSAVSISGRNFYPADCGAGGYLHPELGSVEVFIVERRGWGDRTVVPHSWGQIPHFGGDGHICLEPNIDGRVY